jgi:hypothetical protein
LERQENHSISRAALAKALGRSGRQVRKAIDVLRDKRIRRKGGDKGEWDNLGKKKTLTVTLGTGTLSRI